MVDLNRRGGGIRGDGSSQISEVCPNEGYLFSHFLHVNLCIHEYLYLFVGKLHPKCIGVFCVVIKDSDSLP